MSLMFERAVVSCASGVGEVVGAAQDHFSAQDFLGLRLVWEGILINWRLVWSVVCESGLRV